MSSYKLQKLKALLSKDRTEAKLEGLLVVAQDIDRLISLAELQPNDAEYLRKGAATAIAASKVGEIRK